MTIDELNVLLEEMRAKLATARKEQDWKFERDLLFGINRAEQKIRNIQSR